jgi:transposase
MALPVFDPGPSLPSGGGLVDEFADDERSGGEGSADGEEEEKVRQDALPDGIFPLLTNCKDLSFLAIYTAYKTKQPLVEKRHDLLNNTLEVTPAYLKSVSRLEAFLFMSYIAITVHALIERELRKAMERDELEALPLYPENRECRAPTMARLIEVFGNLQRHILSKAGEIVQRLIRNYPSFSNRS